jgi:uncharacterized iron-regulated protein
MNAMIRPLQAFSLLALLIVLSPAPADEPSPKQKELEASLRQLEKDIAAVRGLEFKTPVVARIIARPKDAAPGIQGYYSLKDKALFIYDDIKGNYERGVLIHEMVHALQDQHFGLKNLHPTGFDSDADLARAALVEGDATFTMIEVLKKDQPHVLAMLDTNLAKARNLQNAFLYGQGARYVKALKERGSWDTVNSAYKFPPRATASILHPDERITAIDLGPGKTRGEYALIELLRKNTARDALSAAAGWRGDRAIVNGPEKTWEIAFADPEQALRCQEALVALRSAINPAMGERVKRGVHIWRDDSGKVAAVIARGTRVYDVEAASDAALRTALDRLEGPLDVTVLVTKEKKTISFGEFTDRLLAADLVCVGESHDSDLHHRVQLQIIKALFARDERLGVGMEMFQRPYQKDIDRYFAGESLEDAFLKATEYKARWGYEWTMYRPIVEFCRKNGVPLAALNASKELTGRIGKVGHAGLTDDERKQLGDVDFHVKAHRDYFIDLLAKMHGKDATAEQKERSYQVMTVWDEYMADSAARFQKERGLRRMVILAGSGHIERGFGIPDRAAKRTGGKTATIKIEVGSDIEKLSKEPTTDYVVIVK